MARCMFELCLFHPPLFFTSSQRAQKSESTTTHLINSVICRNTFRGISVPFWGFPDQINSRFASVYFLLVSDINHNTWTRCSFIQFFKKKIYKSRSDFLCTHVCRQKLISYKIQSVFMIQLVYILATPTKHHKRERELKTIEWPLQRIRYHRHTLSPPSFIEHHYFWSIWTVNLISLNLWMFCNGFLLTH